MSLKTTIQRAAQKAFQVTESLQETITYQVMGPVTHDTATGRSTTPVLETHLLRVLFARYDSKYVDGVNILAEDRKLLISKSEIISGLEPKIQDKILAADGRWDIVRDMTEPSDSIVILQVRRP